ncbi:cytochrome P450 [Xylariales sp. PMI_506]|nr:cytochrome P450 [Xylariales sp. PMI_506]
MPSSLAAVVALVSVPILLVSQWLWPLYSNYRIAQRSGVPTVLVCPFNVDLVAFQLAARFFRPWLELIPLRAMELSTFGWSWRHKNDSRFQKYGSSFVLVTPGKNHLWCADPAVSQVVLTRRKDFIQSVQVTKLFSLLGMSVFTSNHEDWARQRRLVAPQLNERISKVVWAESIDQGSQLVDYMVGQPSSTLAINGVRAIAMNVLMQVGYGESKPWVADNPVYDPKADITYVDSIGLLAKYIFFAFALPGWLLRQKFMSPTIQTIDTALQRIPRLTQELLARERKQAAAGGRERDNMLSMLVRFSDMEKKRTEGGSADGSNQYLTEDEISGNLFVFTAAGFDTTSNTLGYALTMLAAYPEWQSWVQQELDYVWSSLEDKDQVTPDYDTVCPRLTRVLAVMLETMRIFPPTHQIAREVNGSQTISVGTTTYQLDGNAWRINICPTGLNYDPQTWGADYAIFRPSRWITPESTLGDSHLITPPKGSYVPWGAGPRICPGMKMSQVEFTAVVATVFRKCRVEPSVKPGETPQDARENLLRVADDSVQKISMQMVNPDQVVLKWCER